jgi:hypothetical protein
MIDKRFYPDEDELPDNYPVYAGYSYVDQDGRAFVSEVHGDVAMLKRYVGTSKIHRCNIVARTR